MSKRGFIALPSSSRSPLTIPLEAMRESRNFQALMMSNLNLDRTTRDFVYTSMDEAFEELHAAIKAALLGSTPAEFAPTMLRDPSL